MVAVGFVAVPFQASLGCLPNRVTWIRLEQAKRKKKPKKKSKPKGSFRTVSYHGAAALENAAVQLLFCLNLPGDALPRFWLWFMWVFQSHPHPSTDGSRGGGCSGSPSHGLQLAELCSPGDSTRPPSDL